MQQALPFKSAEGLELLIRQYGDVKNCDIYTYIYIYICWNAKQAQDRILQCYTRLLGVCQMLIWRNSQKTKNKPVSVHWGGVGGPFTPDETMYVVMLFSTKCPRAQPLTITPKHYPLKHL
jgi:hypothetical protein